MHKSDLRPETTYGLARMPIQMILLAAQIEPQCMALVLTSKGPHTFENPLQPLLYLNVAYNVGNLQRSISVGTLLALEQKDALTHLQVSLNLQIIPTASSSTETNIPRAGRAERLPSPSEKGECLA